MQKRQLDFSPVDGSRIPRSYDWTAEGWRDTIAGAWRFNPWTGTRRNTFDVESDPIGLLIVPPGEDCRPFDVKIDTHLPETKWHCQRCDTSFTGHQCPTCYGTSMQDVAAERGRRRVEGELEAFRARKAAEMSYVLGTKPFTATDVKVDVAAAREALHDAAEREQILGVKSIDTIIEGPQPGPADHPLQAVFALAIEQATRGKGVRHGGEATPFLEQPWVHYSKMHGRGFLTGQAAKKLKEAASTRQGDAFITEALGALVYIGMAILKEQGKA